MAETRTFNANTDERTDDEQLAGETVAFDVLPQDVIDTDDGGAIVLLGEDADEPPENYDFYDNLAVEGRLDPVQLRALGPMLTELIEGDKRAREPRDEKQAEGIKRTGLGDEAPGGASFEGASKVVHPMLTEACVDFSARAIKELFPPNGPVKTKIEGEISVEKVERAERKARLMNWQLTVQCPEFRQELEQMFTQVPMGGAQYLKVWWDEQRNRPGFMFVPIDDVLLPFAATGFHSANRKTHVMYLTKLDFQRKVKSGEFIDIDLATAPFDPEVSASEEANRRIEGKTESAFNEDGLRTIWEVYVTLDLEKEGDFKPYIVTVDKWTGEVLSVYRNWMEDDKSAEELAWIVEFPFIPWRGAYPIGLPSMIGGLSAAATGALRALLDSAHVNNLPSMLKLKGGTGGQNANMEIGQITELEAGPMVDDVRKLAMPVPYNPPSTVLFQLLGFVVEAGKGVVRTSLDDIPDVSANAPVGTTLSHVEQGLTVYSSVHARLHAAMGQLLRILHRLNAQNLDDNDIDEEVGEGMATRKDFQGPLDLVPVSDPNIFSETQRFAQIQSVAQRSAAVPGIYNQRKVEQRILETLKIPDPEDLLLPTPEPENQNAVSENVAASLGRAIVAFPEQDHLAHIQAHLSYMVSPMLGSSPLFAATFLPVIINHLKEHIALWYMNRAYDISAEELGVDNLDDMLKEHEGDEDAAALDRMLGEAGLISAYQASDVFADVPAVIAQAQQMLQQYQPPPPVDLGAVKQEEIKAKNELEHKKLEQKQASDAETNALKERLAQLEIMFKQMVEREETGRVQIREEMANARNDADNQTALTIAAAEIEQGNKVALSTGTGINPGGS